MTIRAILLDKDGTLIDFDETWGPAAYEVMRHLAGDDRAALERLMEASRYLETPRRFLPDSPLVGGSSAEYGPAWAKALGRPAGPDLYGEMDDLFRVHGLATLSPIGDPGAILGRLARRGYRMGIATNDAEASARAQVDAMGLRAHLPFIAGYDSGHGSKPGPGMVLAFAAFCGLAPEEVALVGDSVHDLLAARAAGAVAVAVLTGPSREAARAEIEPHADAVLGSIADLEDWLDAASLIPGLAGPAEPAGENPEPTPRATMRMNPRAPRSWTAVGSGASPFGCVDGRGPE